MLYRSPDDDGFDMSELQAEAAKVPHMSSPVDIELLPPITDDPPSCVGDDIDIGDGCCVFIIIGIILMLGLCGWFMDWTKDDEPKQSEPKLTTEEALLVEIFEYDYIVIDGVSYPTKDISEIDTKDYPYLTMKLNDFQYAVKFNAHDFTLRKEGCSYGDTTE